MRIQEARRGEHKAQGLAPAHGDIEPLPGQKKIYPPRSLLGRRGGHGNERNGRLLPLELVHGAYANARQFVGKRIDLRVVRSHHNDVVLANRAASVLVRPRALQQPVDGLAKRRNLLGANLYAAFVRDRNPPCAAAGQAPGLDRTPRRRRMARQATFVELGRNIRAEIGVHPPGLGQENAARRIDVLAFAQHPVETGQIRRMGMRTLHDLRELARVPDQNQAMGRIGHGDQIGQRNLPRLVYKEIVERLPKFRPRKQPRRSAHDIGGANGPVIVAGYAGDDFEGFVWKFRAARNLVRNMHVVRPEADAVRTQRIYAPHQHVVYGRVAVRGHRNALAVPDERKNRPRRRIGFARAGRPLHRKNRSVQGARRRNQAIERIRVFAERQRRRTMETRRIARKEVFGRLVRPGPALIRYDPPYGLWNLARVPGEIGQQVQSIMQRAARIRFHLQANCAPTTIQAKYLHGNKTSALRNLRLIARSQFRFLRRIAVVALERNLPKTLLAHRLKSRKTFHVVA